MNWDAISFDWNQVRAFLATVEEGSFSGAARVLKDHGAREIHVATTHAVLCGPAVQRLRDAKLSSIVCTDSIPLRPEQILPETKVLSIAPLLGEAIKRIHRNESVSRLFG